MDHPRAVVVADVAANERIDVADDLPLGSVAVIAYDQGATVAVGL